MAERFGHYFDFSGLVINPSASELLTNLQAIATRLCSTLLSAPCSTNHRHITDDL